MSIEKIRYHGNFFSSRGKSDPRGMKLIGITFELLFESGPAEHYQIKPGGMPPLHLMRELRDESFKNERRLSDKPAINLFSLYQ